MGRIPIAVGENPVNADYLQTKRDRMGHLLADNRRGELTGAVDEPRFALA